MDFTPEQIIKAKSAKTAEKLLALAKESGIEMTEEQAKAYFAELHREGELTDDELNSVAGGSKGEEKAPQEYSVVANWAPSCDGQYKEARGMIVSINNSAMCGKCAHFKFEGDLTKHTEGVCRREFD